MAPSVGLGTEGPVQRGWALWLVSVIGVCLAALFVGARVVQRLVKTGMLGLDDYMIISSLIASGLLSMTECQAVVYGYGRKYASLPEESRFIARKWFYGAQIMYKIVLMLTKVSLVCLYYRIFAVSSKNFRLACHILNGFIITSGMAFIIGTIFQCTPVAAFWDKSIKPAWCFNQEPWWISYSVVQILQDMCLLALPIRQVFTLSMVRAEKIGLCVVFAVGLFATFACVYRVTTLASSANDPDPTWGPIPATVWSVIEANAGIVCACLPMLRQPFLHLFGPLFGSTRTRSRSQSYQLSLRNQQSARKGSQPNASEDSITKLERESEERIIGLSHTQSNMPDGRASPNGGIGGIRVKNEYSVTSSAGETGNHRGNLDTGESVGDDKSGKSTFLHL